MPARDTREDGGPTRLDSTDSVFLLFALALVRVDEIHWWILRLARLDSSDSYPSESEIPKTGNSPSPVGAGLGATTNTTKTSHPY